MLHMLEFKCSSMTNAIICLIMLTLIKLIVNVLFIDIVRENVIVLLSYTV